MWLYSRSFLSTISVDEFIELYVLGELLMHNDFRDAVLDELMLAHLRESTERPEHQPHL